MLHRVRRPHGLPRQRHHPPRPHDHRGRLQLQRPHRQLHLRVRHDKELRRARDVDRHHDARDGRRSVLPHVLLPTRAGALDASTRDVGARVDRDLTGERHKQRRATEGRAGFSEPDPRAADHHCVVRAVLVSPIHPHPR